MAYQAVIVTVMVASPGDVTEERAAIQTIIHNWNSMNAEERRTVFLPVTWETHSTPEMGDRPQAIINRQVVEKCDLLVAVFWTRIGSPTGSAPSGTVEEIRKHLDAGKPAMLYFSQKPVALESVDRDQYEALTKFREECKATGLIATYDTLAEFSDKFSRHLGQLVRDRFPGTASRDDENIARLNTNVGFPISEAAKLMLGAAADGDGDIFRIPSLGGTSIQAGRQQFDTTDQRQLARWESAIRELVSAGFVEPRGYKNESFAVTHEGYNARDMFRAEKTSISED